MANGCPVVSMNSNRVTPGCCRVRLWRIATALGALVSTGLGADWPQFMGSDIWGPLALSDGRLVVRDQKSMKCLDLRTRLNP